MHLQQLRLFIAVAEERHFGRAAKRLHVAQPALSQAIKRFERELGVPLFQRTTRRVSVTDAGLVLLERARRILQLVEEAEDATRRAHRGERGTLRVGFTTVAPHRMLPRLAEAHRRSHPEVRIYPENIPSFHQLERLIEGLLDAGLLWFPLRHGPLDLSNIAYTPLVRQKLVAVVPIGHRLADRRRVSLSDLDVEPFVSYIIPVPGGSVVREALSEACHGAGFTPRIVQEAPDANSLLWMVSAGVGVTLMPECIEDTLVPGVVRVALSDPLAPMEYGVAWRADDDRAILRGLIDAVLNLEAEFGVGQEGALAQQR